VTHSSRRANRRKFFAMVALAAAVGIAQAIRAHPAITAAAALLAATLTVTWAANRSSRRWRAWRSRATVPTGIIAYHLATHSEFEHMLAALCRRDGCRNVTVVGGAGDLAADVLATLPGRTWWQVWIRPRRILIQAKHYRATNKVGSKDVQCVNGTYRDVHGCDLAAIVTTSTYTRAARELADRVGIRLHAESDLEAWAAGGPPPWR